MPTLPKKTHTRTENERQRSIAKRLWNLKERTRTQATTGVPFGTLVIAEEAAKMAEKGEDVIFCAESIISTKVPDKVLDYTLQNFRKTAVGPEAWMTGLPELKEAITRRFKKLYNVGYDPESEVIVTSGSMQAAYFTMLALLDPGDEVIMPVPTFFFDVPVELAGGTNVFLPLDVKRNYVHDAKEIESRVTTRTKMIVVCNPHNPTGRVLTHDEVDGIARVAKKHDLWIMQDQVYDRIVFDGRKHIPLASFPDVKDLVITTASFSKIFNMINYRLGYALANADVFSAMEMLMTYSSMGIPNFIQKGALAALDPDFEEEHIGRVMMQLTEARDYAVGKFREVEGVLLVPPEGTNLIFPNVEKFGMTSMEMAKYLLKEAKVAVAPGSTYHAEWHIRISLGTERIYEAVDRVVSALRKLGVKKREEEQPKVVAQSRRK